MPCGAVQCSAVLSLCQTAQHEHETVESNAFRVFSHPFVRHALNVGGFSTQIVGGDEGFGVRGRDGSGPAGVRPRRAGGTRGGQVRESGRK